MPHEPVEPEYVAQINALAHAIDDFLNPGERKEVGFVVLMFAFGGAEAGRMNYISNAARTDMISALKELVAQFEGRVVEGGNEKH